MFVHLKSVSISPYILLAQVILLEESWNELFLISAIDHCFSTSSDSSSILLSPSKVHNHGVDSTADDVRRNQGDSARDADLSYIRKLIDRFRNLTVDQHEMNFLKAIILFKPFVRGLKVTTKHIYCCKHNVVTS